MSLSEYSAFITARGKDVTVTGVMVNHDKIPNGEGYRLRFNYHGNHCG